MPAPTVCCHFFSVSEPAMPNFATMMKSAFALTVAILATSLAASAASLEVEKLETLDFDLPKAIRLRAEMAALQGPEFMEDSEAAGLNAVAAADYRVNPARWAHVYRASDGQVFLVDNLHMALWVRVDDKWTCVLPHVRVEKPLEVPLPGFRSVILEVACSPSVRRFLEGSKR